MASDSKQPKFYSTTNNTMNNQKTILTIFLLLTFTISYGQKKFKVVEKQSKTWNRIYYLVDIDGKTIRKLDTSKYNTCFNFDSYGYFAIFGKKNYKGWAAIDANENVLFNVYNTSFGEPTPDYIVENKIRIVDSANLIGFANSKGRIIIKPKYEIATSFHKGKAIIGLSCTKKLWGEGHLKDYDCHHYTIICKKHGFINTKGEIKKIGNYSFEQIAKEINWKETEE